MERVASVTFDFDHRLHTEFTHVCCAQCVQLKVQIPMTSIWWYRKLYLLLLFSAKMILIFLKVFYDNMSQTFTMAIEWKRANEHPFAAGLVGSLFVIVSDIKILYLSFEIMCDVRAMCCRHLPVAITSSKMTTANITNGAVLTTRKIDSVHMVFRRFIFCSSWHTFGYFSAILSVSAFDYRFRFQNIQFSNY